MHFANVDFPGGAMVKNLPANAGDVGLILGQKDPLEKEMTTHSNILAWEILRTEKTGGVQSRGSQPFVRHDLAIRQQHFANAAYVIKYLASFYCI